MIKLDNEYYINYLDGKNITLVRKYKPTKAGPKGGEVKSTAEEIAGYYVTVSGAVMAYRRMVSNTFVKDCSNLEEYVGKVEALDKRILKALKAVAPEEITAKVQAIDGVVKAARAKPKDETKPKDGGK